MKEGKVKDTYSEKAVREGKGLEGCRREGRERLRIEREKRIGGGEIGRGVDSYGYTKQRLMNEKREEGVIELNS